MAISIANNFHDFYKNISTDNIFIWKVKHENTMWFWNFFYTQFSGYIFVEVQVRASASVSCDQGNISKVTTCFTEGQKLLTQNPESLLPFYHLNGHWFFLLNMTLDIYGTVQSLADWAWPPPLLNRQWPLVLNKNLLPTVLNRWPSICWQLSPDMVNHFIFFDRKN